MNLTNPERLILAMLCDIHKHLGIQGDIDAELVSHAILGNTWALDWQFGGLTEKGVESDNPAIMETADILQMYTSLKFYFERLDGDAKDRLEKNGVRSQDFEFPGFDGNNDEHYHIASFMIKKLGRFSEYSDKDINSHDRSSIADYRRMLPKFKAVVRAKAGGDLGDGAIEDVMKS